MGGLLKREGKTLSLSQPFAVLALLAAQDAGRDMAFAIGIRKKRVEIVEEGDEGSFFLFLE